MTAAVPPPPPPAAAQQAPGPAGEAARARQDFLRQIGWTPAPPTGQRPLVAVLDTGVDAANPNLRDAVVGAARSFVPGEDPLTDPSGHGTHVAGIIASVAGNGIGEAGVPRARILPVTIADRNGRATSGALVRGLRYASARGARVINISFGGKGYSRVEQAAIDDAVRRGALVVAPVGNNGGRVGPPEYPGAYRHVVTVAALGRDGRVLPFSARGDQVALAAPGELVASVQAGATGLVERSGTSMAAAVVSGAAARVMAARPGVGAERVRAVLEATARDVPPAGPDRGSGWGAVDLRAALAAVPPPSDREPNDTPGQAARMPPLLGPGAASGRVLGRTEVWSDPRDDFRVVLRAGERVVVRLGPGAGALPGMDLDLYMWRPGTPDGPRTPAFARAWLVAASLGPRSDEEIDVTAPVSGSYTVEVQSSRGAGPYVLTAARAAIGATPAARQPR